MRDADRIADLCLRIRKQPSAYLSSLDYPPVTDVQIREVEEQLGFTLPSFLRALYTQVTNGGRDVGPGLIMFGILDGCQCPYNNLGAAERHVSRSGWRLYERIVEALQRNPGHFVQSDELPDRFIMIGDWGCSISIEVDGWTGQVYLAGCGTDLSTLATGGGEHFYLTTIEFIAPSLEDWFERWLDVTSLSSGAARGMLKRGMVDVSGIPEDVNVWRGLYYIEPSSEEAEAWADP